MKAFHTIAIPHRDILEGRLTMDVFAADLWEVRQKRGPDEYKDAETFFRKTYLTQGMQDLLGIVEKRLRGEGGDPVIQIQTPFGGGKTHALIAMYHKAETWKAAPVVIVGEKLQTGSRAENFDTLWGVMEEQLTGTKAAFSSPVPPGGEQIKQLLQGHAPVLILMDELIPYLNTTDAVQVGDATLTTLTLTFLHNLTNVVSEMGNVSLVLTTTPSNPYNRTARGEELVAQLQDITARREIIKSPVQEDEIARIIRRRLFGDMDLKGAESAVAGFVEYAEKEGILPTGMQPSEYRDRFLDAYPFMPEVVDVLYHRWGSFPTFQRTRGVLRLLALVIRSLKETHPPYISLADFDLSDQEIRQELLRNIGPEYNGVIAADITDVEAGSKKVDVSLGRAYQGLHLGSRTATTIFLYSFSGGHERGTTLGDLKRCATTLENPASVVAEAVEQSKGKLFYLQDIDEKYFFDNQPNINRILRTRMENVKEGELVQMEQELLRTRIQGGNLGVFVWEEEGGNIPDSADLKLVILKKGTPEIINGILTTKGLTPRVYRNALFFLYPSESERAGFVHTLKRKLAYQSIEQDKHLSLSDEQKKDIRKELKNIESGLKESIRRFYRSVAIPDRKGFKETDLGIPTYGEDKKLDQAVYEKLRSDGEILEKIVPLVIKEKYLSGKDYVKTEQVYQSCLKTPGETRPIRKGILEQGIAEGVRMGLFGLGELEEDTPVCGYFRQQPSIMLSGNEVLISELLCREQKKAEEVPAGAEGTPSYSPLEPLRVGKKIEGGKPGTPTKTKDSIQLRFEIPKGKVSNIMGVINLLQSKFETVEIALTAKQGTISEQDYEDKIEETFRQLEIELKVDAV